MFASIFSNLTSKLGYVLNYTTFIQLEKKTTIKTIENKLLQMWLYEWRK